MVVFSFQKGTRECHRKREGGKEEMGRQTSYFQLQREIYWLYLPSELMLWLYAT